MLGLTLAVGALSPWFPALRSGNELSRLYLTEALLLDGTVAIDGAIARHGDARDKSRFAGRHLSDKAPGVSLVALPAVALYRALAPTPTLAGEVRAARVAASVLPTFFLLWALLGWLRETCDAGTARALTAAAALGSLSTTYGTLLFGHQLAATCVLLAWRFTRRLRGPPANADGSADRAAGTARGRAAFGAGLFAGAAVCAEYPAVVLLLPLGVAFVRSSRLRPGLLGPALLGAALPLGALLLYHHAAFGHPLHTGYRYVVNPFFAGLHDRGLMGVGWPKLGRLGFHLVSARKGLFFFAPWLALALPGLLSRAIGWRRPADRPPSSASHDLPVAAAVVALGLLLLLGMAYDNGGWTLGQRHLTALVPWLTWLVGQALVRWPPLRPVFVAGALVALVLTGLGTAVYPYYPERGAWPSLQYGLHFARAGVEGGSLWSALGLSSLAGALAVAAAAALGLLRWLGRPRPIAVALALAALWFAALALRAPADRPDARRDRLLGALQAPADTSAP